MAITVSGSSILYSDSSAQSRKPMKLITEVINSSSTSQSIYGMEGYNQYILVWDANQYTGPGSSSLTLIEGTTTATFYTRGTSSLVLAGTSGVSQIQMAAGTANLIGAFSSGSSFVRGNVVITKIRNMTSTTTQLWNVDVAGGGSSGNWFANHRVGTTTTGGGGFGIGSLNLTLGYCNEINIRLYGIE